MPTYREMCSWGSFCALAREPEQRKVGSDAHISIPSRLHVRLAERAVYRLELIVSVFAHGLLSRW